MHAVRSHGMLCLATALVGCLALAGSASAAPDSTVRTYDVSGVRSLLDRSAVGATGAAIIEVDHGSVVVTASRSDSPSCGGWVATA